MYLVFQYCVCGLMSRATDIWLQDATYLELYIACIELMDSYHSNLARMFKTMSWRL